MTTFTIKRLRSFTLSFTEVQFIHEAGTRVNKLYGSHYDFSQWRADNIAIFCDRHYLAFCYDNDTPKGFMVATRGHSFFDPELKTLDQRLLYSNDSPHASILLLKDFIDFGKHNAKHIITMIGSYTNLKPRSLEKLGFKKLEDIYRMEVPHGK